ncbi:MAG: DnaJ domain-containing protein [Deltaproteobacteria bacterium]|nr:MAG: DnaJ domain-containing protein [Deltaproteobacteria bacterium]
MEAGNLKDNSLPQILLDLYTSGETGVLRLKQGKVLKSIHFMMGMPIFASSTEKDDRMGEMLCRKNIITDYQLRECLAESEIANKKLGTVLVEKGLLKPEALVVAVVDQVEEIIYSLFGWEEGEYSFVQGEQMGDDVIPLDMSAANLIMGGIRKKYSLEKLKRALGSPQRVLATTLDSKYRFNELQLTPEESKVINLVDGTRSIGEILEESGVSELEAHQALAGLLLLKTLEVKDEELVEPLLLEEDKTSEEPLLLEEDKTHEEPLLLEEDETHEEPLLLEEDKTHEEPLLLEEDETHEEPLLLEEDKTHEEPLILEEERAPETGGTSIRKQEVSERYQKLSKMNLYEKLGLSKTAAKEEIVEAYTRLSKEFHPEKFTDPHLDDVREQAMDIFNQITEAYTVLVKSESRAQYDQRLSKEVLSSLLEEDLDPQTAKKHCERGKVLFQEGRYREALDAFKLAIQLDPNVSEYHTGLGLLYTVEIDGQRPRVEDAERSFKKAIYLDQNESRNYFYLGVLYKNKRAMELAKEYFEKALEVNPRHSGARQELMKIRGVRQGS